MDYQQAAVIMTNQPIWCEITAKCGLRATLDEMIVISDLVDIRHISGVRLTYIYILSKMIQQLQHHHRQVVRCVSYIKTHFELHSVGWRANHISKLTELHSVGWRANHISKLTELRSVGWRANRSSTVTSFLQHCLLSIVVKTSALQNPYRLHAIYRNRRI